MNSRLSFIASLRNSRNGKADTSDLLAPDLMKWINSFQRMLARECLVRNIQDNKSGDTEHNFISLNLSKVFQALIRTIVTRKPFFTTRRNAEAFLTGGSYSVEHQISNVMKERYCDLKIIFKWILGMDFIGQSPKRISKYGNPDLPALRFHELLLREYSPKPDILFITVPVAEYKN